ncbi:hypothetical protein Sango_0495600 [Sesamum angolense]|uniref:Uncharacterized protein n=1 Tax=Sesamum angolense TaxID=2727404 RepID=A0AAE2C4W0_9LAMI|nr:hypothetical protein Sango_0495600 [Sesamum angolense]
MYDLEIQMLCLRIGAAYSSCKFRSKRHFSYLPLRQHSGDGPINHTEFSSILVSHVKNNLIPMSRIDDAVRRILRIKFTMGSQRFGKRGCQKITCALKEWENADSPILPLPKETSKILVAGKHANNLGLQCVVGQLLGKDSIAKPYRRGKLPRTWFKTVDQLPMNVGDEHYDPLFPFGFGLTTKGIKG